MQQVGAPTLPSAAHEGKDTFLAGREFTMLWTIAVLLLILWLLGMVSSYTLGGFIHILLVLAIVAVLIRLIQGRSPVL
jgi:asparagine N-glycosylation enzyme membrane subunit Stt3